jgi:phage terminase large subunit
MVRDDGMPMLMFFDNCTETVEDLKNIQTDDKNPNDCAKEPHEITHAPDMVRYYCISRTLKTDPQSVTSGAPAQTIYDDEDEDDYNEHMTGGTPSRSYMAY